MLNAARSAGVDSPVLFVFLPKNREDVFRDNILRMRAARAVLDLKGVPATREAEEARDVMETRRKDAERNVHQIIEEVLAACKVFKGGGSELHALELVDKVQDGCDDALWRLFPHFDDADHKAWRVAMDRARKGDDSPLQAVSWKGSTEDHRVCKEVEALVAGGKEGRHIRAHFEKPPYGWPRDAIDAALIALHAAGRLIATNDKTGESIQPRHLDQNRIPKAKFRTESVALRPKDRIAVKGLIQAVGIIAKPDDDLNLKADEFLAKVTELARAAGGEAPLPARPATAHLEDIRKLSGNERLVKLLEQKSTLQQQAGDWKKLADLAEKRLPDWQRLNQLLDCGGGVEGLAEVREAKEAILRDRLLLESSNVCAPLIKKTADKLRAALTAARSLFAGALEEQVKRLESADLWQQLSKEQQDTLLGGYPLPANDESSIATDEDLLTTLRSSPLAHWKDRTDALPAKVDALLAATAKLLEPKAQHVTLPSGTIRSPEELEAWLAGVRKVVETKLKDGPVIL